MGFAPKRQNTPCWLAVFEFFPPKPKILSSYGQNTSKKNQIKLFPKKSWFGPTATKKGASADLLLQTVAAGTVSPFIEYGDLAG